jgi:dinuclear metal center YbgI/SA1388 family protein
MKIREIIAHLEEFASPVYQEGYDNSTLIVGDADREATSALITLDCTENVVDEAIKAGCNLIIAHHPIVFKGMKSLTGKNYIERTVLKAIKNDIALYAIHTNLDNVKGGVNFKIAERLNLKNVQILAPKHGFLKKLITYIPIESVEKVKSALFAAGAGNIGNYDSCSFVSEGTGSYRGNSNANPTLGKVGEVHLEKEYRLEVIFSLADESRLISALKASHPYEEVAYDILLLQNSHQEIGSGIVGELEMPIESMTFLKGLKKQLNTDCVRHTNVVEKTVQRIAVCGGSGSFLLKNAIAVGADVFITGDFKYHEFFDAENKLIIADVGHYESEQFTKILIKEILHKKIPNFATHLSQVITNPINYL